MPRLRIRGGLPPPSYDTHDFLRLTGTAQPSLCRVLSNGVGTGVFRYLIHSQRRYLQLIMLTGGLFIHLWTQVNQTLLWVVAAAIHLLKVFHTG